MIKQLNIILIVIAAITSGCANTGRTSGNTGMPQMQFTTLQGASYNANASNQRTVIFYFDPNCPHCKRNTEIFTQQANRLNNINVLLVSPHSISELQKYNNTYNLDSYQQLTVYHDNRGEIKKNFNPSGYPTTYLFEADGSRVKSFQGVTDVDQILAAYNQN